MFIKKFNKNILEYPILIKYLTKVCKLKGFNCIEFFEHDGDNFIKNKFTVRLSNK